MWEYHFEYSILLVLCRSICLSKSWLKNAAAVYREQFRRLNSHWRSFINATQCAFATLQRRDDGIPRTPKFRVTRRPFPATPGKVVSWKVQKLTRSSPFRLTFLFFGREDTSAHVREAAESLASTVDPAFSIIQEEPDPWATPDPQRYRSCSVNIGSWGSKYRSACVT